MTGPEKRAWVYGLAWLGGGITAGHVGFYVAEDATHYHVLGGNQSNAVTITRIAKARLLASRWPRNEPVQGKPVWVKANGVPVSENEA